jgi:hypothetical protein
VQRIRTIAAGLILSAFAGYDTAFAAGMSPDPTGLWFDPAESGWGLSLVQRDDTIFALLLVYDEERRPTWYVASNVTLDGPAGMDPGAMQYTGVLYRTTGPWFGGAFDPQSLASTAVGTIRLQYVPGTQGRTMALAYAVNGVTTVREIESQVQPRAASDDPVGRSQVH